MRLTISGTKFQYWIDEGFEGSIYGDGFIARGTESIVYKGIRRTSDAGGENIEMDCVLKFKRRGRNDSVLNRFKNKDLRLFNDLQGCRSVVRIFDLIEDIGDFLLEFTHVGADERRFLINSRNYFCVVEEYIEGKTLEEYCLEYAALTDRMPLVRKVSGQILHYYQYQAQDQEQVRKCYADYDFYLRYQSKMYEFMLKLCDILEFLHRNRILHLDLKPDNIMITNAGEELVLIDFGRANYMEPEQRYVRAPFSVENADEYGTVGFAAPEAFCPDNARIRFDSSAFHTTKDYADLTIESDIFSFGATFWECLNIYRLFTGNRLFAKKVENNLHYQMFYDTPDFLNDDAYCGRDLSVSSCRYHEKLEDLLRKCTRRRTAGYTDENNDDYYHQYTALKDDIQRAKESSPAIVKTENIKVRNAFGVSGVMAGLIAALMLICFLLKITGGRFASAKVNDVLAHYNLAKIEMLANAVDEQMQSSTEREKQEIFERIQEFFGQDEKAGALLQSNEVVVLTDMLSQISDADFRSGKIDSMLLQADQDGFSRSVEYLVTNLPDETGTGYILADGIYKAQKGDSLLQCYQTLEQYADVSAFRSLTQRLAQDLNHEEKIEQIAKAELTQEKGSYTDLELTEKLHDLRQKLAEYEG